MTDTFEESMDRWAKLCDTYYGTDDGFMRIMACLIEMHREELKAMYIAMKLKP